MKPLLLLLFNFLLFLGCKSQQIKENTFVDPKIATINTVINQDLIAENIKEEKEIKNQNLQLAPIVGAQNLKSYIGLLKDKKIALVVNQTSTIGNTHLVDSLVKLKVNIVKIFGPEHGFRGTADAGEHIENGKDPKTGIPVISLYGDNKKPTPSQLADIDLVIFDIQDVGARFYTYISTLHYLMEACGENNKKVLILDRPNPNGHYVDGPVLQNGFESFVGMDKIPVVHGMTIAEYALMLNGEKWLKNGVQCELEIVKCQNYTHQTPYSPPIPPSPNLKDLSAIYLYPSLCFFEGTPISVGRGTDFPFKVFGHPTFEKYSFSFVPTPKVGATSPLLSGKKCNGVSFLEFSEKDLRNTGFTLKYLIDAYNNFPDKAVFFNDFFKKLAGNDVLYKQIKEGKTEDEIRKSWQPELDYFKKIRKKYLLYLE
ncbi:MAG: DUF1343 domain-containing protein [Bacteroidetes bacterium]|nr:DUF1343 domain-containing protein [Bacteroidota bacterium]